MGWLDSARIDRQPCRVAAALNDLPLDLLRGGRPLASAFVPIADNPDKRKMVA